MVSKILKFGKQKGGSTLSPAHGLGGAKATILPLSVSVPPSARKKFWPSNQAGGNAGAGFQFIRARPAPASPGGINSGGASEQTLSPENLKCLDWSQLLNAVRTYFERN